MSPVFPVPAVKGALHCEGVTREKGTGISSNGGVALESIVPGVQLTQGGQFTTIAVPATKHKTTVGHDLQNRDGGESRKLQKNSVTSVNRPPLITSNIPPLSTHIGAQLGAALLSSPTLFSCQQRCGLDCRSKLVSHYLQDPGQGLQALLIDLKPVIAAYLRVIIDFPKPCM